MKAKLTAILARENSVLDPDDAENLAEVILAELPIINATSDLLSALKTMLEAREMTLNTDGAKRYLDASETFTCGHWFETYMNRAAQRAQEAIDKAAS